MGRFHQHQRYSVAGAAAAAPASIGMPPAPPAARRAPVVAVDQSTILAKIGFYATLLYIFGVFSLSEELAITFLHVKPYLTTVTGLLAVIAAALGGRMANVFRFTGSRLLIAFSLCLLASVPMSTWRGGSWQTVFQFLTKSLIVMVLLLMTVTTWRQIRLLFMAMMVAAGLITLAVRSSLVDLSGDPRLAFNEGRLANPNDLATHLLVLIPFCVAVFFLSGRFSVLRPASAIVAAGALFTVLRTGSRGALVTIAVLGVVLLWKLPSAVHKLAMAVMLFLAAALGLLLLPGSVVQRYKLLFSKDDTLPTNTMEQQALESSESRRAILRRSIEMTFEHPVFGVGPGNFATAENRLAQGEGRRGAWLQTHNSYTQVSSECGIPALLMFASAIVWSLRRAWRYHSRLVNLEMGPQAIGFLAVLLSLLSFAVNICFASLAYTFYVPTLVGMVGALAVVMDREVAARESGVKRG